MPISEIVVVLILLTIWAGITKKLFDEKKPEDNKNKKRDKKIKL